MLLLDLDRNTAVIVALTAAVGAAIAYLASRLQHDPREPPLANTWPPVIGHALGLLWNGSAYLEKLTERTPYPIFTVPLPGSKMYLVKDPDVAALIHRHSRTLTFIPIVEMQVSGTCGITQEMWDKFNPGGEKDKPISRAIHKIHHANLVPSKIHDMHVRSFGIMTGRLNEITSASGPTSVRVEEWLRSIFTMASASAMYGDENPIARDPNLVQHMKVSTLRVIKFWSIRRSKLISVDIYEEDEGFMFLGNIGGFLQPLIAPKGYEAMQKFQAAFNKYYNEGLVKNASEIIRRRYETESPLWGDEIISKLDILLLQAALMNMMVTSSWLVWRVFSDPDLLRDIREEVLAVVERQSEDGVDVATLDGTRLILECPLLLSTWMELLRYYAAAPIARFVSEDTELENGCLLKEGSVVQLMGGVMHKAEEYWGPTASSFEPRRFLKTKGAAAKRNKAFAPFGGGIAWCPGRHYVSNEALAFVSALVLAFEIKDSHGGLVQVPEYGPKSLVESIRPPVSDPWVGITRRPDFASAKIVLKSGSGVSIDLSM